MARLFPTLRRLTSVLVGLALLPWLGCERVEPPAPAAAPAPRTVVRFQTDWYPQAEHGGFYQALAKGYYAEAGLDVTVSPGGPGPKTPHKIIGGLADIAMYRSDDLMTLAAEGLPFVIVGAFMQHDPQAILLHEANPIDSFPELDGAAIMAIPGTNWIPYLQAHYGIALRVIPMNFGLAQFMADPTFIQQCFITSEPFHVRQQGGHPKTLLIARSGYDPYRVIFTTRRFAEEHPDAVRAFVAASLRGWHDFLHGDPAPAKALIREQNPQMTEALIDFSIQAMREHRLVDGDPAQSEQLGQLRAERLQAQHDTLLELGILKRPLPTSAYATFEFLPPELAEPGR